MEKLTKLGSLVGLLLLLIVFSGGEVSASTDSYSFRAKSGDSQSILVRRAIQLHTEENDINLSPAAAIYCETNIVQNKLGGLMLEIDDHVSVPIANIDEYIDASGDLNKQELENWQAYADQASFSLNHISALDNDEGSLEDDSATQQPEDNKEMDGNKDDPNDSDRKTSNDTKQNNDSFWTRLPWIGIIAAMGVGMHLVRKHQGKQGK